MEGLPPGSDSTQHASWSSYPPVLGASKWLERGSLNNNSVSSKQDKKIKQLECELTRSQGPVLLFLYD